MSNRSSFFKRVGHGLLNGIHVLGYSTLEMVIDTKWSTASLSLILNETDDAQRNELITIWRSHRLADLDRINITSVLVAGVISSAFSWYNLTTSPWVTRGLWYCGLIFAMAAITTAGVHSAGLHRIGCHPDWHSKIRKMLGHEVQRQPSVWHPYPLQPIMWQSPGLMLKAAIVSFLVGLSVLIWETAVKNSLGVNLSSEDTKIAILFTTAAGTSIIMYGLSVYGLFFKSVQ